MTRPTDPKPPASEQRFPVLSDHVERKAHPSWPRSVPWSFLAPHEERAKQNHDQSLERLAARGGLGLDEMAAIVEDRKWRRMTEDEVAAFLLTLPSPAPPEQPAPTLDNRFHELWTQAVGSPRYVKDQWRALEGALGRSLDTRESEVLLRIAEIVVAHSKQPAEQPARGDGRWQQDRASIYAALNQIAIGLSWGEASDDPHDWKKELAIAKQRVADLVAELDDAPGKDGAK